ncbi:MAG: septum formation initiator family protein [Candidatus Devosia euplotis]|nr:septum formation initiator family protein [Candidatus Devosia euplotis]
MLGFQGYLGFSVIGGQFGIENRTEILIDIDQLKAQSAALQAEIGDYRHRATLMDPRRLDPDIVTERARSLLNMANADDIIVMVDRASGKPVSSKFSELASDELISINQAYSML